MNTAVVTGGGRGMGRLIAQRLSRRGYAVLVTDINAQAAEAAAREIGSSAWAMAQDVRNADSHRQVAKAAGERGPLKVWVNNAGVLKADTGWGHSDVDVALQVEVNLLGLMWGSRAAVEAMRDGGGHIINLGSMSALTPTPGLAVYGATKMGVLGFSISLQGDLNHARIPVKVSVICPDAVETDMVKQVEGERDSALLFSSGKLLTPDRVADLAVGLLDDYKLVLVYPRSRGVLARIVAPFPELGLKILEQYRRLGERNRKRRQAH
jgi:NAD(P)-dependent dehydrogenase (short-subunit alcohol dehydrogenase family)